MNAYALTFAPQLPIWLIAILVGISAVLVMIGLIKKTRGAWLRIATWLVISLALFNPSLVLEDRQQLKNIIALVTDNTASQKIADRERQSDEIRKAIIERIGKLDNFEIRQLTIRDQLSASTDATTALFEGLKTVLQDTPPEQVGGAIFITDGQVHDIPKSAKSLGINAPVHALITGRENERDRRIEITNAPRFGIVGESITLAFSVKQQGINDSRSVAVTIVVDGEELAVEQVTPETVNEFDLEVPHGGKSIIELRAEEAEGEISTVNNRAYTTLNGIRENLRVLLVSGEPHAGERTWRNLLKSDASVDLVHFTILRPPDKQDGTPINQLSLIAFPTRELFVEKIDEFDLIIFDRYSRRGVLPTLYFDNIARYVEDGGAVLVAAGPEFADPGSIAQTPLQRILPAIASGRITEAPFTPAISKLGERHPITRNLDSGNNAKPDWSRWFRSIGAAQINGDTIMTASDDAPLLIVRRAGEGRIALMLSDHVWLWARGFEGGGPHVKLLRRLAHWLMKEPELSEEYLTANSIGSKIKIRRQTLENEIDPFTILGPNGDTTTIEGMRKSEGIFEAEFEAKDLGLYQINNGDLQALTHVGPANPREFANVISTPALLAPILEETGGSAVRVKDNIIPRIIIVGSNSATSGKGWIGLRNTNATLLRGINTISLFSGLLGLAALLLTMAAMWAREGR